MRNTDQVGQSSQKMCGREEDTKNLGQVRKSNPVNVLLSVLPALPYQVGIVLSNVFTTSFLGTTCAFSTFSRSARGLTLSPYL